MFQLRHVALAHRRGMATQPASCWAQHSRGEQNRGRCRKAGSSSRLAWDYAVLTLPGAFSFVQSSQKMGLACWQAAHPHEMWAQLIKGSLICAVDRRLGTQMMPHICTPEGHSAFHGDLGMAIMKSCLLLYGHDRNHYGLLLHVKCEQDFSVGKNWLCCY